VAAACRDAPGRESGEDESPREIGGSPFVEDMAPLEDAGVEGGSEFRSGIDEARKTSAARVPVPKAA
jgi:hypothetical protein